jgi:hypothetical protein
LRHELLEEGGDTSDGKSGETQSEDTIKLAESESNAKTTYVVDLSKSLLGGGDSTGADIVNRENTGAGTRSVFDLELGTILGEGGGFIAVVLVVAQAIETAVFVGDPQVAGSGVEDHVELLRRVTDSDGTVILSVLEVVEWQGMVRTNNFLTVEIDAVNIEILLELKVIYRLRLVERLSDDITIGDSTEEGKGCGKR